jgi:hypothetical protein
VIEEVRFARDSALEGGGFEPSVPCSPVAEMDKRREIRSSRGQPAPKHTSGGIRLPIAWRGARRTSHFGTFLPRHFCFDICGCVGARGTVLMTFVSSVHNPKIMLSMLVKVLCSDSIATRRRLSSEGDITLEDLMRVASDFDIRTVTIEGLTSVRYLLSATVGIVTVIAARWSSGLSWSHNTLHFDQSWVVIL